jgi:DNA-directed RNA polymerase specialized sigma24 family protein
MRIYEEKTFATIAKELKIPLGTALGRMRAALIKLRAKLTDKTNPPDN